MIDPFGRRISYLRLSVTDRCDLRCTYCMPQRMTFLPRDELLSLEELDRLCSVFIDKGVRKLRLTGGEPLVRRNLMWLVRRLSRFLESGALDELTMTTNGSRLAEFGDELARCGVRRINVSLDSLNTETYTRITRGGRLENVLRGIDAAQRAGLKVKLNVVALREDNLEEIADLAEWAHGRGADLSVIEVMPMGKVDADRRRQYVPIAEVRSRLAERWALTDIAKTTGGPARYMRTDAGGVIGFITPLSRNFCGSCNRVRVSCTGQLFTCLGHEGKVDLRSPLRSNEPVKKLHAAIDAAILRKPKSHDFAIPAASSPRGVERHMSVTGG
jgi:cyclic pyranopterin phosphate synthase